MRRKHAVREEVSDSAIIQALAATSFLRYTDPSLPIVMTSDVGSLSVLVTMWPGGVGC